MSSDKKRYLISDEIPPCIYSILDKQTNCKSRKIGWGSRSYSTCRFLKSNWTCEFGEYGLVIIIIEPYWIVQLDLVPMSRCSETLSGSIVCCRSCMYEWRGGILSNSMLDCSIFLFFDSSCGEGGVGSCGMGNEKGCLKCPLFSWFIYFVVGGVEGKLERKWMSIRRESWCCNYCHESFFREKYI